MSLISATKNGDLKKRKKMNQFINFHIRVGNEQAVSRLIQNGANININEMSNGETALHIAAAAGNLIGICCFFN